MTVVINILNDIDIKAWHAYDYVKFSYEAERGLRSKKLE